MPTRTELHALYKPLQDEGLTHREIADRLGKSRSAVASILHDPDGSKQRERRKRYQGECVICGKATDGSNGRDRAPRYCIEHLKLDKEYRARLIKWPEARIIACIQDWNEMYGEPPAAPDWGPTIARGQLHDEERANRFEAAEGRWPWFTIVVRRFGSWNAGIVAAGLEPRQSGGGGSNVCRRRSVTCSESEERPLANVASRLENPQQEEDDGS